MERLEGWVLWLRSAAAALLTKFPGLWAGWSSVSAYPRGQIPLPIQMSTGVLGSFIAKIPEVYGKSGLPHLHFTHASLGVVLRWELVSALDSSFYCLGDCIASVDSKSIFSFYLLISFTYFSISIFLINSYLKLKILICLYKFKLLS